MSDFNQRERAQLGMQYIEDAVVNLLVQHPSGLTVRKIAEVLGLSETASGERQEAVASGICEMLVESGRILWDGAHGVYVDNPDKF